MNDSFKVTYDPAFFERLCPVLERCIPAFNSRDFIFRVFNNKWPDMPYHERVTHIASVLRDFLPSDFARAAWCLTEISRCLKRVVISDRGMEFAFLLKYVELFGTEHVAESAIVSCVYRSHAAKVIVGFRQKALSGC
jgi:hypothetical protein